METIFKDEIKKKLENEARLSLYTLFTTNYREHEFWVPAHTFYPALFKLNQISSPYFSNIRTQHPGTFFSFPIGPFEKSLPVFFEKKYRSKKCGKQEVFDKTANTFYPKTLGHDAKNSKNLKDLKDAKDAKDAKEKKDAKNLLPHHHKSLSISKHAYRFLVSVDPEPLPETKNVKHTRLVSVHEQRKLMVTKLELKPRFPSFPQVVDKRNVKKTNKEKCKMKEKKGKNEKGKEKKKRKTKQKPKGKKGKKGKKEFKKAFISAGGLCKQALAQQLGWPEIVVYRQTYCCPGTPLLKTFLKKQEILKNDDDWTDDETWLKGGYTLIVRPTACEYDKKPWVIYPTEYYVELVPPRVKIVDDDCWGPSTFLGADLFGWPQKLCVQLECSKTPIIVNNDSILHKKDVLFLSTLSSSKNKATCKKTFCKDLLFQFFLVATKEDFFELKMDVHPHVAWIRFVPFDVFQKPIVWLPHQQDHCEKESKKELRDVIQRTTTVENVQKIVTEQRWKKIQIGFDNKDKKTAFFKKGAEDVIELIDVRFPPLVSFADGRIDLELFQTASTKTKPKKYQKDVGTVPIDPFVPIARALGWNGGCSQVVLWRPVLCPVSQTFLDAFCFFGSNSSPRDHVFVKDRSGEMKEKEIGKIEKKGKGKREKDKIRNKIDDKDEREPEKEEGQEEQERREKKGFWTLVNIRTDGRCSIETVLELRTILAELGVVSSADGPQDLIRSLFSTNNQKKFSDFFDLFVVSDAMDPESVCQKSLYDDNKEKKEERDGKDGGSLKKMGSTCTVQDVFADFDRSNDAKKEEVLKFLQHTENLFDNPNLPVEEIIEKLSSCPEPLQLLNLLSYKNHGVTTGKAKKRKNDRNEFGSGPKKRKRLCP